MNIIVINGASGTGKSTVLQDISNHLPRKSALLDGDDVGRQFPKDFSVEWVGLVHKNIFNCAINYNKILNINNFIFCFVFPGQGAIDNINRLFDENKMALKWINLIASDECLQERLKMKGCPDKNVLKNSIEFNENINKISPGSFLDVTGKSKDKVRDEILDLMFDKPNNSI